ncbi:hypothetical protein DVH26_34305 [Paenibacillus sp. H1-7]|nr:hypothetical protein DVH26_34305 [Paenibacillus sp. H1-7]
MGKKTASFDRGQVDNPNRCFLWIMWTNLWMSGKTAIFLVIYRLFFVDNHVDKRMGTPSMHRMDKQENYGGK